MKLLGYQEEWHVFADLCRVVTLKTTLTRATVHWQLYVLLNRLSKVEDDEVLVKLVPQVLDELLHWQSKKWDGSDLAVTYQVQAAKTLYQMIVHDQ